jgi:hypothetical protein
VGVIAVEEDFGEQFAALGKGWEIGVEGEFAVKWAKLFSIFIIPSN